MSMCILFSWRVGMSCVWYLEAWAHGRPTELFWMDWILGIRYYIEGSKRIIAQMYPKYKIKVNNIFHCFIRLKKEKNKESNDDGAKDAFFLFKMIWDGNLLFNISVWFGYLIFPMVSSTVNLFLKKKNYCSFSAFTEQVTRLLPYFQTLYYLGVYLRNQGYTTASQELKNFGSDI